jgi:hypothetical protein
MWYDGLSAESSMPAVVLAGVTALSKLAGTSKKPLYKLIRTECQNITQHIVETNKKVQESIRSAVGAE